MSFREDRCRMGWFLPFSLHIVVLCVCGGVTHCFLCMELVLYSHYWVMCLREWEPLLAAQSLRGTVCHMCHVKVWLRAISRETPGLGLAALLYPIASFGSDLLTNVSALNSQFETEGPIPGQA